MKLWRKQAKKTPDGKRNGRSIKSEMQFAEAFGKTQKLSYPLLDALIERAGIKFAMTKKEIETYMKMIEEIEKGEKPNETV